MFSNASFFLFLVYVFLGAGAGGVFRVLLERALFKGGETSFPWAIWTLNLLGSFLLGLLWGWVDDHKEGVPSWLIPLVGAGFLGGMTTFSTFSYQVFFLLKEQKVLLALSYALSSCVGAFILVAVGYIIFKRIGF